MSTINKNRLIGLAIGFNLAAAISTFITGCSTSLTTHITLLIVLLTMLEKEKN
jgi:tetrahydromethanopterin S-methyltransferase subunit F